MERGDAEAVRTEVLEKAVRILELLADHPAGLPLAGVSQLAALPKTSAHRLLLSWVGLGYVLRLPSGDFALGLQAVELSRKVARRSRPVEICHGLLRQWQRRSNESVYLGVYRNGAVVLVDAVESDHPVRVVVDLGEHCHLHASAQGLSVAAFLEPDWLREKLMQSGLKALTKRTNTDWRVLMDRLTQVRREGYAVNSGETVDGACCLGAPVFAGAGGAVIGSIGVSLPEFRAIPNERERQRNLLLEAAAEMTQALSGLPAEAEARPKHSFSIDELRTQSGRAQVN
jgi:IclR family acetate operon transcriptional repressor